MSQLARNSARTSLYVLYVIGVIRSFEFNSVDQNLDLYFQITFGQLSFPRAIPALKQSIPLCRSEILFKLHNLEYLHDYRISFIFANSIIYCLIVVFPYLLECIFKLFLLCWLDNFSGRYRIVRPIRIRVYVTLTLIIVICFPRLAHLAHLIFCIQVMIDVLSGRNFAHTMVL